MEPRDTGLLPGDQALAPAQGRAGIEAGGRAARLLEARLDALVQDPPPVPVRVEGGVDRVAVGGASSVSVRSKVRAGEQVLVRQGDPAHQAVVGIEGDPEPSRRPGGGRGARSGSSTVPVWTFEERHSSSGIRWSRT